MAGMARVAGDGLRARGEGGVRQVAGREVHAREGRLMRTDHPRETGGCLKEEIAREERKK